MKYFLLPSCSTRLSNIVRPAPHLCVSVLFFVAAPATWTETGTEAKQKKLLYVSVLCDLPTLNSNWLLSLNNPNKNNNNKNRTNLPSFKQCIQTLKFFFFYKKINIFMSNLSSMSFNIYMSAWWCVPYNTIKHIKFTQSPYSVLFKQTDTIDSIYCPWLIVNSRSILKIN